MLPTSLPGAIFGGITAARPTSPRAARRASVGIDAASSGVRPPERVEGLVGAAVGDADHVLHRLSLAGRPAEPQPVPWTEPCPPSRSVESIRQYTVRSPSP